MAQTALSFSCRCQTPILGAQWKPPWHDRYFNAEIYCRLNEKLEPLGRVNELIEAAMDVEKFDKLVSEFPVGTVIV